jgi:hypothetical protein
MTSISKIQSSGISKLPFWDVDYASLDLEQDCLFILEKVFNYGLWSDYRAAFALYGQTRIRQEIVGASFLKKEVLSFALVGSRYPYLQPIETVEGIRLASVPDIIAMKLNAITRRSTKKDFFCIPSPPTAGAKAASLVPAIRAGSTGQPNLCQHSLDIRPEKDSPFVTRATKLSVSS